jgi:tetratricopeptide (TPR) repeat protein
MMMRLIMLVMAFCWFDFIQLAQADLLGQAGETNVAPVPVGKTVNLPECPEISAADNTQLEMIGRVVEENRPYAALAFLDASHLVTPKADLLRASSLRQTNQLEAAAALYRKLIDSCVSGYAYQGLGLIYNQRGQNEAAAKSLAMAAKLIPIDSAIRADYGYALAVLGQNDAALNEYLTAIELNNKNRRAINNLLLLMLKSGQQEKALQLAKSFGMTAADLEKLKPGLQLGQNRTGTAEAGSQVLSVGGVCEGTSSRPCTGILSPRLERLPNE